jgi:hypothetical protein
MATVNAIYEDKVHGEGAIKKCTGFKAKPCTLDPYCIRNIREKLDEEHIAYLESCYLKGEYVEPVVVVQEATETGMLRVLEGRHRTHAAIRAAKQLQDLMVEVRTVPLSEAVQFYGFMLKSDRRLPFSFLEKALGVAAMKAENDKLTTQQLADVLNCTKTAIENYLLLASGEPRVLDLVREGRISGSQVVEYIREHGDKAYDAIIADLERAAAVGKPRTPRAPGAKGKFSHGKALDALEILLNVSYDVKQMAKDKGEVSLKLGIQDAKDLIAIIDEYQIHCGVNNKE